MQSLANAMTPRVPVSVLIPIKNEAENLPRCLESVQWADEILVVDSHSTDGSAQIAEQHGAKVAQFDFNGTWPKKKNWALENLSFKNDWVFILDADEVLPAEAQAEISNAIANAGDVVGYWINRRFMFLGRWLRHSYYPNWNLRLFRHALGRYERLTVAETRSGDNEVHEHVVVQGPTARLRCEMDHYAFPSIEVFIEKHNRYSNWEARVAADELLHGSSREVEQCSGRAPPAFENAFAAPAVSPAAALSLHLHLAERISRRPRRLLLSPGSTPATNFFRSRKPTSCGDAPKRPTANRGDARYRLGH